MKKAWLIFLGASLLTVHSVQAQSNEDQGDVPAWQIATQTNDEDTTVRLLIDVYPNPVREVLMITLHGRKPARKLHYNLVDGQGRVLQVGRLNQDPTILEVEKLANGTYYMMIYSRSRIIKSFRIIKMK
jgi:hypothetical protein